MRRRPRGNAMRHEKSPRLIADESGSMTIYGLILFVMVIATAGLVADVGRLFDLHSQAQGFVDQVALASAAELDGSSGAIDRAAHAAVGDPNNSQAGPLIKEKQNFATGSANMQIGKLIFLESLGPDPAAPAITPAAGDVVVYTCTVDSVGATSCAGISKAQADLRAHFVAVETTSLTQKNILLPMIDIIGKLFGANAATSSFTISPQATAGFTRSICNNAPTMMCNPYESTGNGDFTPEIGKEIIVQQDVSQGNYGVLCPNGNACRDLLAKRDPNTECVSVRLPGKPGTTTGPVDVGMNVRFDMYDSPYKANKEGADPEYAPAANVTKGLTMNCGEQVSSNSMPLPDDNCYMQSPSPGAGAGCSTFAGGAQQYGDGTWARDAYWTLNHPGKTKPANYSTMSRYDIYRYEIDHPEQVLTSKESGAPTCTKTSPVTNPKADRRVLIMPIANCKADSQKIIAFGKFFLLEPLNSPYDGKSISANGSTYKWKSINKTDLRLEMMGRVNANAPDGVLHEDPVLYR